VVTPAPDVGVNIAFVADDWRTTGGTAGQCALAERVLRARGHAVTRVPGVPKRGAYDVVLAWVRTPGADLWRAGGGSHRAWLGSRDRGSPWRARLDPRDRRELVKDRACQAAAVVIANSRMALDQLVEDGVAVERLRLLRNGVDLERFSPAPARPPRAGRVALFLGHGFRRKGLDVAVRAFERVGGVRDQLWVAGHDAHAARWRRRARSRLGDRLRWLGPVSNVDDLLQDVDVLLHPTRYDSAANSVLEAMAAGVPAVTTRADGAAEVVPAKDLIVDTPDDVDGTARALGYAWEVRQPERWRAAAEAWPGSRMGEGLETLLMEWLHAEPR
jgi:UDP-glucose:(heptosyl)LPS alpha-1,3-glucosyltransferase